MKGKKILLAVFLIAGILLINSRQIFASIIYQQNFDTLNLGDLDGQDSWVKTNDPSWQVQNTHYYSSPNALRSAWHATDNGLTWRNLSQSITNPYIDAWVWFSYDVEGGNAYFRLINAEYNAAFDLKWNTVGGVYTEYGQSISTFLCTIQPNTWSRIQIEIQLTTPKQWRSRCVGINEWSEWISAPTALDEVSKIDIVRDPAADDQIAIDNIKIGTGSLPPSATYSIAITQPINATTTADFASWQVDYQFFGGDAASTNTENLRLEVRSAATSSENTSAYYSDYKSVFTVPDNSTSVRSLTIPKANVLLAFHDWYAWARLYEYLDPNTLLFLAASEEISFYVSTSTRAWPYPSTTTATTLGFQCDAYTFPVNQMCNAAEWLIMPNQTDLEVLGSVKDEFLNKAPMGYLTALQSVWASLSVGSASTTLYVLSGLMDPIKTGLEIILWVLLGVWLFNRIRHLQL